MLSKRCRALIQSAVAIFMLSVPLAAQTNTSTIAGVVTDQSGAAVANAKVVATLISTGQTPMPGNSLFLNWDRAVTGWP
jgi:hypothetical protein